MNIINTAAYKFVRLDSLLERQSTLKSFCIENELVGTILISEEGINICLAGTEQNIAKFESYLKAQPAFSDIWFKHSPSDFMPFHKIKVRIKKEIITFRHENIRPGDYTVKHLDATEFKKWLDEGREMVVLDTRNDYEVEEGTFVNAVNPNIRRFTDLTTAVEHQLGDKKDVPMVMFCTGGVRCEKAGPAVEALGFKEVYQLNGGILAYFEECGGAHYEGNCFVFDDRVLVDPNLQHVKTATKKHYKERLNGA